MSAVKELLDKNKQKIVWYSLKEKVKTVVTNVVGVLEDDIKKLYGSVEYFEKIMDDGETDDGDEIKFVGYCDQITLDLLPRSINPVYVLKYQIHDHSNTSSTNTLSEREDRKGFHLCNYEGEWRDDGTTKMLIQAYCQTETDVNWNNLREDLGLSSSVSQSNILNKTNENNKQNQILTIEQAKIGLSNKYDISVDKIEITFKE